MKKLWVKKILLGVLFLALLIGSVSRLNGIVMQKDVNRCYIMDQEIGKLEETPEVEVFGSCHAYSSFDVPYYQEHYGLTAYNMSNPGEFLPITYVRMAEQFRKGVPDVALVDTWGLMVYDTYSTIENTLEFYSIVNLESIPQSPEKKEVINDFGEFDSLELNFPLAHYKDRLIERELLPYDFDFTRENVREWHESHYLYHNDWLFNEMDDRIGNRGNVSWEAYPQEDYDRLQSHVEAGQTMPIEDNLMKYLDRIIDLCRENGVELIFYRAPYLSTENELKKANFLAEYLAEQGIPFYDLEAELDFDPMTDFFDEHHLAVPGMAKATDFLGARIQEALQK